MRCDTYPVKNSRDQKKKKPPNDAKVLLYPKTLPFDSKRRRQGKKLASQDTKPTLALQFT